MAFYMQCLLVMLLWSSSRGMIHINLHYTDRTNENQPHHGLKYDCFIWSVHTYHEKSIREIVPYCIDEYSLIHHIKETNHFPKFTFLELANLNITSEQLYDWSAPIDIVENYQLYINQLSMNKSRSSETQIFYNCTFPMFGTTCQYEIDHEIKYVSSLGDIIYDYYETHDGQSTELLCYTQLTCNRGPHPACLNWRDICNGVVDCIDQNNDEEHCWQLEISECDENEYRCQNGQCVPMSFLRDDIDIPDCLDKSDESHPLHLSFDRRNIYPPTFSFEEHQYKSVSKGVDHMDAYSSLLFQTMYSAEDDSVPEQCLSAVRSTLYTPFLSSSIFNRTCRKEECQTLITEKCPDMFYFPNTPLFLGDVYLAYTKNDSLSLGERDFTIPYLCYTSSRYDAHLPFYPRVLFKNRTCFRPDASLITTMSSLTWGMKYLQPLHRVIDRMKKHYLLFSNNIQFCNRSNMYQCMNASKCISINRLLDAIVDCPQADDENMTQLKPLHFDQRLDNYFKCNNFRSYIYSLLVTRIMCYCANYGLLWCNNAEYDAIFSRKDTAFQNICDGLIDNTLQMADELDETDETNCDQWPCNNIYTHCNYIWDCLNGEDETGCYYTPSFSYPSDHHLCISPDTNQFIALPVHKAHDGRVDCLGGTDERSICEENIYPSIRLHFYCSNHPMFQCITDDKLCDTISQCKNGDDEKFCVANRTGIWAYRGVCLLEDHSLRSDVETFLCDLLQTRQRISIKHFSLVILNRYHQDKTEQKLQSMPNQSFPNLIVTMNDHTCNYGFPMRLWLENKDDSTKPICFCPPSYYGERCQYQSQRVSVTIKFQTFLDSSSTLFAIIISLIDDSEQRTVHSFEQFTYLSLRDCQAKFNRYLLYSTRPKNQTNNYAVHVDIYEKNSLNYRGSLYYPILFSFLPVYRLAIIASIPGRNDHRTVCSHSKCVHGVCVLYSNGLNERHFCQCDQEWTGKFCHISYVSTCATNSISIGISSYNRSICVCRGNTFGYRCLLTNRICETNSNHTCANGGQCIPTDDTAASDRKLTCVCQKGFVGERCETIDNRIILSFSNEIVLPQSIFIHFIRVMKNSAPIRSTTFRTIPTSQSSLVIYWSQPFHITFLQFNDLNYYLSSVQTVYQQSTTINKTVKQSDRCPHFSELLNRSIVQMNYLRRVKYYHIPCEKRESSVECFYDETQLCMCYNHGRQRLANCFEFNHTMKFDCLGQNICENDGQCFQDVPECSTKWMCRCEPCFYGIRCQFSSTGFSLSLDAILGYHIEPNTQLRNQPTIVKISLTLVIVFMIAGLVNGITAFITFNNRIICEVGCGLYLFGSSITNLLTTFTLGLKFFILLFAQMSIISNRLFLQIQCLSLDFILRICFNMDQCLNACVAVERAATSIQGASFKKEKSKKTAKWTIIGLLVFIIATTIYDPIYRRLIDEDNDNHKRIWCIATYPLSLRRFDSFIHLFYFLVPFIIQMLSAIIIIAKKSRMRSRTHGNEDYVQSVIKQIRQHKHLIVPQIIMVFIGLPRLIISLSLKCMKSLNEVWLFLIVYFITFIPSMGTYLIFISPSKFYKKQLYQSWAKYRNRIVRSLKTVL